MTAPASPDFGNRVVVVTGAFGALGEVIARSFADRNAHVVLLGRSAASTRVSAQFSSPHLVMGGVDLVQPQQIIAAMDEVRARLGRIDVLVNVAGGFRWEKIEGGSLQTWDEMYSMNLKTAVAASSAALPHLLASAPGSRIVNIGSGAASKPAAQGMGAYAASKVAVQKLTEALADELKDRGVTVNAVLPGTIDTPQNRADMPKADFSHWVAPAAIAEVVLFLASPAADAVTGAAIPVTAGH